MDMHSVCVCVARAWTHRGGHGVRLCVCTVCLCVLMCVRVCVCGAWSAGPCACAGPHTLEHVSLNTHIHTQVHHMALSNDTSNARPTGGRRMLHPMCGAEVALARQPTMLNVPGDPCKHDRCQHTYRAPEHKGREHIFDIPLPSCLGWRWAADPTRARCSNNHTHTVKVCLHT